MGQQLGDKLGPRLARLWVAHHLAVRRQLAPVESKIAAAATQQLIDRAGLETADHYRPVIEQLQAAHPAMAPWLSQFLDRTKSGHHQWQAIAGILSLTGVTGGLGTVMANEMAPATQFLLQNNPNLHIDQNAAAMCAARGVIDYSDAQATAAEAGFNAANFAALYGASQTIPDPGVLADMRNRGLITEQEMQHWIRRGGIPPELTAHISALARQLLTPADAALAVLRGNMSAADGYAAAAAAGTDRATFDIMIGNTGEPPAIEELLMLWRRGKIDTATLDRAITQSRVRTEWIPVMHELATEPPSAAEVMHAYAQGQIPEPVARQRWAEAGGDPTWFKSAYDSANAAPTPIQLAEMANRRIIPWDGAGAGAATYHQGYLEGPWKDKWEPAFRQLAVYHPPPREVTTLIHEAGMSEQEADQLWQEAGLTPEMAHLYWKAAHYARTSALHHLSVAEIRQLYQDRAVSRGDALKMLEAVNWTQHDAEYLLDLADFQLERKFLELAISKIHSLFVSHKIDANAVGQALGELEVPASQREQLLKLWRLEAAANVRPLTEAQITQAYYYKIMSEAEALGRLQQLGYSPRDAWIALSIKIKGPLQDTPEPAGA